MINVRTLVLLAALAGSPLPLLPGHAFAAQAEPVNAGPYVPTPQYIVDRMLYMARVTKDDFLMDLGSGDGRIVITAAKAYETRGVGVDINEQLVERASENAHAEGVYERVRFEQRDVFKTDISNATVLMMYLLPHIVIDLRPKILAELRPGARVVSHDYDLGDWEADEQTTFESPEKARINGATHTSLYLYIVPAQVAGRWRIALPDDAGAGPVEVTIRQTFQKLEATLDRGGRGVRLPYAALRGDRIRLGLPLQGGTIELTGTVAGDTLTAAVDWPGRGRVPVEAKRVERGTPIGWK